MVAQIEDLVSTLKDVGQERRAKLDFALETLQSSLIEFDQLRRKIDSSKSTWLVADLRGRIDFCQPAPSCVQDFVVLATDGSHIDVDRHHSACCFVINIGIAQLQYGSNPDAWLSSSPSLYFRDDEVVVSFSDGRQAPIEGQLLGVKRSVEECRVLAERAG